MIKGDAGSRHGSKKEMSLLDRKEVSEYD
jgi:hypothetical protein